jgi:pimeloyl-ACP methyl ester carboxylesterase
MKRLLKSTLWVCSFLILISIIINIIANICLWFFYDGNIKGENFQKINNINIHYKIVGNGPPILLLHDFLSSSMEFDKITAELSTTHKVVAIDLPGFGLSDKRTDINYSRASMAEIAFQLMTNLGFNKFSVMGHCMGGEVALNMAVNHNNNIDKIILVDSTGYDLNNKVALPSFIFKKIYLNYLTQLFFYFNSFYNKRTLDFDKFEINYYLNKNIPSDTLKKIINSDDKGSIKDKITTLKTPTLIIWGMNDKINLPANSYKFNTDLQNSTLILFSNTGHNPHIEQLPILKMEILKFLSNK